MDLTEVKTDDLVEELEKRKKEVERPKKVDIPEFIGIKELIETCESMFDDIVKYGASKGAEHHIYTSALECIYGKNVWEWINKYDGE